MTTDNCIKYYSDWQMLKVKPAGAMRNSDQMGSNCVQPKMCLVPSGKLT